MYCIIRRNPKTCKEIIDSDDELPTEIDEIPFVPAYLRDNRFDDTEKDTVELDFLSTAEDDSPDQQLNVPSEVRISVDSRRTRRKTYKYIIDSDDELSTEIDEAFISAYLKKNQFDDTETETVEIDCLSTATDDSPDQQLSVPSKIPSSVAEIDEAFISAYLRKNQFDDTETETVEIDFLSTATNDSPDQQLSVPYEVRSSVDSRVTRPKTCKDIIDSDDELPTEIDEIPFVPAYLRDNRFDDTEKDTVELDFLSAAKDDCPDQQLNVPSQVRSSVAEIDEISIVPAYLRDNRFDDTEKETVEIEYLRFLTTNYSSDQSSCWCELPCEVRWNLAENIESPSDPAHLKDNLFEDTENEIKGFEFLTTNDGSDQQHIVPSEVGGSRTWVFGSKVAAVGVFKFGTSELEPESELESEVVAEE